MIIYGRNPVKEAYRAGKTIEKLYLPKGAPDPVLSPIYKMAKEKRTVISYVDKFTMDKLSEGGNHQGVLAQITDFDYCAVEDILARAKEKEEDLLVVLLDGITDPHNLGAIIRSAHCAGAHGVIIPKRGSAGLNPACVKAAAGATEYVKTARVTNLSQTIEEIKQKNVWVYAADMGGQSIYEADLSGPLALVIGSEGEGVSRLVRETCDGALSIPMKGRIDSLNASVAAGIMLFEAARHR